MGNKKDLENTLLEATEKDSIQPKPTHYRYPM